MSDQSQGEGWWRASDGKWYPPESASAAQGPPPEPAEPSWWARRVPVWAVILITLLALGIGIAAGSSDDDTAATATGDTTNEVTATTRSDDETTTTRTPTTRPREPKAGEEDNPLPLGESATVEDWEVTVVELREATAEIRAANQFNDPPDDGSVYVLMRVRGTYNGSDEGTVWTDLSMGYLGEDRRIYKTHDCNVVTPDSLNSQPDVARGGTVEGNVCFEIPQAVFGTGAAFVEAFVSFDDDHRVWWA